MLQRRGCKLTLFGGTGSSALQRARVVLFVLRRSTATAIARLKSLGCTLQKAMTFGVSLVPRLGCSSIINLPCVGSNPITRLWLT
mmetsp:Transcript_28884/g.63614  ORF Transcript_28884/g.63614 Transcript_28884/m.63614 type:complete len:85 (+) Transcript_28884:123-377(+)